MSPRLKNNSDKYLSRLITGKTYIPYKNRVYEIRTPTPHLKQMAAIYYDNLIRHYRFESLPQQEQFIKFCIRKKIIPDNYKTIIKENNKMLEDLKISLFRAGPKIKLAEKIRERIKKQRQGISKFLSVVNEIKLNSLEGFADHARRTYLFLSCVYDDEGHRAFSEKNDEDSLLYNHITYHYGKDFLEESEVRELIRSYEWRSVWGVKKHGIFKNEMEDLSDEQKLAASYSDIYDFAFQHEKCPKEEYFDDDDFFDGWYLYQVNKIKSARDAGAANDSLGNKDDKYSEIFVLAQDQEEADAIYSSNSQVSKKILKARGEVLRKSEGKSVRDIEFSDVKQDLRLQAMQKFKENVGSKNG
jgi:hypothetical protein